MGFITDLSKPVGAMRLLQGFLTFIAISLCFHSMEWIHAPRDYSLPALIGFFVLFRDEGEMSSSRSMGGGLTTLLFFFGFIIPLSALLAGIAREGEFEGFDGLGIIAASTLFISGSWFVIAEKFWSKKYARADLYILGFMIIMLISAYLMLYVSKGLAVLLGMIVMFIFTQWTKTPNSPSK